MKFPNNHIAAVYSLAFNSYDQLLCSGDYCGTINLWDLSTGALSTVLQQGLNPDYAIGGLAFRPDGRLLAATSMDRQAKLKVWNLGQQELLFNLDSDESTLAWSPDGKLLACGSNQVTLRDGATGEIIQTFSEHKDWVTCLAFSHDGTRLATGTASEDGNLRVWDVRSGKLIAMLSKPGWQAERIMFITENTVRFSYGYGTCHEWELGRPQDDLLFEAPKGSLGFPTAISPDGKLLAYETQEGDRYRTTRRLENGDFSRVRGDGYESAICVVDIKSRRELNRFWGHIDDISCMNFNTNATLLASADQSGEVFVWDIDK